MVTGTWGYYLGRVGARGRNNWKSLWLAVTSDNLTKLVSVVTAVAFCNEVVDVYLATDLVKTSQHLDEDEFIDVEKYTLDDLKDMIFAGTIQDSKTISAVLAYDALLNRKKNN